METTPVKGGTGEESKVVVIVRPHNDSFTGRCLLHFPSTGYHKLAIRYELIDDSNTAYFDPDQPLKPLNIRVT